MGGKVRWGTQSKVLKEFPVLTYDARSRCLYNVHKCVVKIKLCHIDVSTVISNVTILATQKNRFRNGSLKLK